MNAKDTYNKWRELFIKKCWPDPVWSKVISTAILAIVGSLLTTGYVFIKSLYQKIPFKVAVKQTVNYLQGQTSINNLVIWLSSLIIILWLTNVLTSVKQKFFPKTPSVQDNTIDNEDLPVISEHSTAFFSYMLAKAFPGLRGFEWYQPQAAVKRLNILLKRPLMFKPIGHGSVGDPIWWFRGHSALFIEKFDVLSATKVLIGNQELEIKRIGVFISKHYYRSFVYIEAKGEKQTGLYNYSKEDIERQINMFGYSYEEYGLLGKFPIRREEYDDGAANLNDNIVDASSAELRIRVLSDYNFIIAAKQSPYNSIAFERESEELLNNLLNSKIEIEHFIEHFKTLEKNERSGYG